eukprot:11093109-Prorocentrum_lima.AAC.1
MAALVNLAQKRVAPYARTPCIIPSQSQEVPTPKSTLIGAYTIRGRAVTKATCNNDLLDGIHALARL